jgi:hypothetical protein
MAHIKRENPNNAPEFHFLPPRPRDSETSLTTSIVQHVAMILKLQDINSLFSLAEGFSGGEAKS